MVIPIIVVPVQVQLALRVPLVKISEVAVAIAIHPDQICNIPPMPLSFKQFAFRAVFDAVSLFIR